MFYYLEVHLLDHYTQCLKSSFEEEEEDQLCTAQRAKIDFFCL
jgi:hypothetical protein